MILQWPLVSRPLRSALDAFVNETQKTVKRCGKLKLYKGNIEIADDVAKFASTNKARNIIQAKTPLITRRVKVTSKSSVCRKDILSGESQTDSRKKHRLETQSEESRAKCGDSLWVDYPSMIVPRTPGGGREGAFSATEVATLRDEASPSICLIFIRTKMHEHPSTPSSTRLRSGLALDKLRAVLRTPLRCLSSSLVAMLKRCDI